MINKIKSSPNNIGNVLDRDISAQELEKILRKGVCIHEASSVTGERPRVLFLYDARIYVRCIDDTLKYIQELPNRLQDASRISTSDLVSIIQTHKRQRYTLSILTYMPGYEYSRTSIPKLGDFK